MLMPTTPPLPNNAVLKDEYRVIKDADDVTIAVTGLHQRRWLLVL